MALALLARDQLLEPGDRPLQVGPPLAPGGEEAFVAGEHEGAQAHLELVDDPLEAERGCGDVLRLRLLAGRAPQVGHRDQHDDERAGDQKSEERASRHHPAQ